MSLNIGTGITIGPGISFSQSTGSGGSGGGGGGGGSYPTFTFSGLSQPFTVRNIVITPDGLTVYGVYNNNINVATLGSLYDLTSFTNGSAFNYPFDVTINRTPTLAFNANGTKAITVIGNGQQTVSSYNLATPYVMSSLTGSQTYSTGGGLTIPQQPTHLLFANSGMIGYVFVGTSIYQWNLTSAYDINSFSGTAAKSIDLSTLFSLNSFNPPSSFALSSDGKVGYISSLGNSFNGSVIQFSLSTPFDVSTIQSPALNEITGFGGYGSYLGTALSPSGKRLFVSGKNSSGQDTLFQFNGV